jgi:hypothetical protein
MKLLAELDAVIIIDGDKFTNMKPERSIAVADHELTHLHVLDPAKDDNGVARIELIRDDWHLTGFVECVERHGENAIEARAIAKVGQVIFPFMDDAAVAPTLTPDVIATKQTATEKLVETCAGGERSKEQRARDAKDKDSNRTLLSNAESADDPASDEDLIAKRDAAKKHPKGAAGRKRKTAAVAS